MQACRAALQAPVGAGLGRPGAGRAPACSAPASTRPRLVVAPGANLGQQRTTGQRPRQLSVVAAAKAGGGGNNGGSRLGRKTHTAEPQPKLQAWLQKQGLSPTDADEHARRLAHVFGGDQQVALASLPATFAFCRSQGLTALQTAQLLDSIAKQRPENVVSFATTAQPDWQLIDDCITAHAQRQQRAGKRLPKHTSLASLLCGNKAAPKLLTHAPDHVADWLAAVGTQEVNGQLLLGDPLVLNVSPDTTLAVLRWFVEALEVPPEQAVAFAAKAPTLLKRRVDALQRNLELLKKVLPPQRTLQVVRKQPQMLAYSSNTVQQAAVWLGQQVGNAERLHVVLEHNPKLLTVSTAGLQRRTDFLQRQYGWQPGDGQLAAWIEDHPRPFGDLDFDAPETQAKLLLLTGVLGLDLADCLTKWSEYLARSLETTAARYILVQERAPWMLYTADSTPRLTWMSNALKQLPACGAATKAEVLEFERSWPESEQGRRLLAALRSGSTDGWPLPPTPEEASEAEKRQG